MADMTTWKVLLVDDEPDSLSLIHDMLMFKGIEVRSADNGADGLALLDGFNPTVVVVDLSMPKPDGWDILSAIRAAPHSANLPVLAITAYYSDKVIAQAKNAGFNALLSKPIKLDMLMSKLEEVVG
jgi:two-component system, chemotaxis family, CheB/CheR fusion protein